MSIEAAAKAVNDGGWTCDLHEPEPFGDCKLCVDPQRQLVRNVLIAFAGDRVLYVDALKHDRDEDGRCTNLRCLDPSWAYGVCYGVIQVYPEVTR